MQCTKHSPVQSWISDLNPAHYQDPQFALGGAGLRRCFPVHCAGYGLRNLAL
jgi:hypothetical protein